MDLERPGHLFVPRNAKSGRPPLNKQKAARMLEEVRMAEPGMAEAAKANGAWSVYGGVVAPIHASALRLVPLPRLTAYSEIGVCRCDI